MKKPTSLTKLLITLPRAIEQGELRLENVELKERVEKKYRLIGESAAMERVRAEIAAAGPTQASVLIAGGNGSGEEIVAREIQQHSRRATGTVGAVNCG